MTGKRQSGKKDVEDALKAQAARDNRPPIVSNDPVHPGDECPCTDCKASR